MTTILLALVSGVCLALSQYLHARRLAEKDRLVAALRTANAEKDAALMAIQQAIRDDAALWSLPADYSADARYWQVH